MRIDVDSKIPASNSLAFLAAMALSDAVFPGSLRVSDGINVDVSLSQKSSGAPLLVNIEHAPSLIWSRDCRGEWVSRPSRCPRRIIGERDFVSSFGLKAARDADLS